MSATIVVRAHAKLNLDLRVTGRRSDNYHELRTVYQTLALHDTLAFAQRPGPFVIRCASRGVPRDHRNLVWKAAAALWDALGRPGPPRDIAVTIDKAIPMQAGLGGGSADAAATLAALAKAWRADASIPLASLAAGLGADVPFFLVGGTALGVGRGDEIYPLMDLPRYWVTLVCPDFGVPTVDAYRWCDADRAAGLHVVQPTQYLPRLSMERRAEMLNDLEPPVVRRHPDIGMWKQRLLEGGALAAAMSGSGSAVFGLFDSRGAAARTATHLPSRGVQVVTTRTLARAEHERLARPVAKKR